MDKGNETFKELMTMLSNGFADMKKNFPWEYKKDINDYCRMAPLYWPKPTSYTNLMYISVMGKGSKNSDNSFFDSDYAQDRNPDARDEYKALKNGGSGSTKKQNRSSGKRPKNKKGKSSSYDEE